MKESLSICFLGDVCPDRKYCGEFDFSNPEALFGDVLDAVRKADIAICNLEAPASLRGRPISKCGPTLHCKPSDIDLLSEAGIKVFSLANNHILDYGEEALLDTVTYIEEHGLSSFGAGRNIEDANKPMILEKNGRRIGCISFAEHEFNLATEASAGANPFDPYRSFADVRKLKSQCDYLIVFYHGGIENYEYPSPFLQKKCRAMVRAGADLVLCQHSHCIGTVESYQEATILYGQGNAIFGRGKTEDWNTGMLVTVDLTEEKTTVSYRVFEAGEQGISFVSEEKNAARLQKMAEQSACLSDEAELKKKWDAFCKTQTPAYLPMLFCWGRVRGKLNRILKGKPIERLIGRKKKMIAMNLVRCDAHRDVVQTILENTQK